MDELKDKLRNIFFRNMYNLIIVSLIIITIVSVFQFNYFEGITGILVAVVTAGTLDTLIKYYKTKHLTKQFRISKSGVITGLFIGMILAPNLIMAAVAAFIAILSKHVIKYKKRHIFNPANFGILVTGFLGASAAWWATNSIIPIVLLGFLVLYRMKRIRMFVSFIIPYSLSFLLFSTNIENLIPTILNSTVLFFAFFMLLEPRTSPGGYKGQIIYGSFVGLLTILLLQLASYGVPYTASHFLNIALVFGNILAIKIR